MSKLRNNGGFASIILLLFAFVFLIVAIVFSLEILGYIEIPKEYSLTRFIDYTVETTYNSENDENEIKIVKKKTKNLVDDDSDSKLEIHKYSSNSEKEETRYLETENEFKNYYYNQLEDEAKNIYNKIIDNLDNLKTGRYTINFGKTFNDLLNTEGGDEKLNNYFQSAVNAILLDNPDIFYLDITKMYLLTKSTTFAFTGTTYEVSIGPSNNESYLVEGFSANSLSRAENNLANAKEEIINSCKSDDVIEIIKNVHDYLVDNLEYDSSFSEDNIYNMYGALVNNLTVCEGYAKAFKSIMDEFNIPCVVVCGYAMNSNGNVENHAWNDVLIKGKWYAVDVTWDDPIIIGGGVASKESRYKYFLKGSKTLFEDHEEDGNVVDGASFKYPKISKEDY